MFKKQRHIFSALLLVLLLVVGSCKSKFEKLKAGKMSVIPAEGLVHDAKWNELLRIEETANAPFAGWSPFPSLRR